MDYNLKQAMEEYCPYCGRGEEAAIKYVKAHDANPIELYKEVIALENYTGRAFLGIILSSNYNVFTPWYKAALIYFKENGEMGTARLAKDILDFYKEAFEKVGELNEIQ